MAFPSDYLRSVIYGTGPGGEIWQTGFSIASVLPSGSWALSDMTALNEAIAGLVATWWTTFKGYNSAATKQTGNKLLAYDAAGGDAYASVDHVVTTPVVGTNTAYHPGSVAAVQSLRTTHAGKSGRGRMYAPTNAASLDASHEISTSTAGTMATATAALLSGVNTLTASSYGATSLDVVVVSQALSTFFNVNNVVVDTKLDIQRRRTNRQTINGTGVASVSP